MATTAAYAREWIYWIYRQIPSGGTLSATIETIASARVDATSNGAMLSGVSANGQSTSFALPEALKEINPRSLVELCDYTRRTYTSSLAALVAAGDANPSDQEIRDEMIARTPTVRRIRNYHKTLGGPFS